MRVRNAAVAAVTVLLAGCGDDVAKACFDTADHANLSDGKAEAGSKRASEMVGYWALAMGK